MIAFADLLERLGFTTDPVARVALLRRYFETQGDPERGYALGILARLLRLPTLRPATLRALAAERCDAALFDWSHAFVGDLAETVALIWPPARGNAPAPTISEIVGTPRAELSTAVVGWLDASDAMVRVALLKLLTGGFRSLATGAELRSALGGVEVAEVWHAQTPPFLALFAWLDGRGPRPASGGFLPFMLPGRAGPGEWLTEPLWEGARVLVSDGRVFSREADDATAIYPEFCLRDVVVDGVVTRDPRCLRLFDILFDGAEDLRGLGFADRRVRLEAWFDRVRPKGVALSPLVPVGGHGSIAKRADSPYVAGSSHDYWVVRPRLPRNVAAVLLYAEAGRYTIGLWREGVLIPVGQAVAEDPVTLDAWVRGHTIGRYGSVREVEKSLVVSVTFGSVRAAPRRKAGVVLEGARIGGVLDGRQADDLDALGGGA